MRTVIFAGLRLSGFCLLGMAFVSLAAVLYGYFGGRVDAMLFSAWWDAMVILSALVAGIGVIIKAVRR